MTNRAAWTRREALALAGLGLAGAALPLGCRHAMDATRTDDMERKDVKDVVVVGGGPGGLSAALALGRGRKKVLVCDAGTPRNAAAEEVHTYLTRDGIPPREFRRVAWEQMRPYDVELREARVLNVERAGAVFRVALEGGGVVAARRVLLATGMVDVMRDLPGYGDLWGKAIFQCPFCHGWEIQDRAWGVLATNEVSLDFAVMLTGWTRDLVVFAMDGFEVPADKRALLEKAGVRLETRRIRGLIAAGEKLDAVELEDGTRVPREILFDRPPQRQSSLVQRLGLELNEEGFVKLKGPGETSVPGIYAAGDLGTRAQAAIVAASAGMMAAGMLNHDLNLERAGAAHGPAQG
ncbi:NAD(P)/FAD-dependent oxidoreductase [Myxococcus xanthus]|uniref:NAD(P)/FAD-dependent oxidoreductase n=1 Tax=Myxococcus xanthus TaxID=34 RepID=UPI0019173E7A|nr:NAD(P)/FAD-dependent oxidoreductase [Myxococcus xanthus]QQR44980.1 NAD(P)/FAD-dependent oxidoreductase [Myxococcus xanthus]